MHELIDTHCHLTEPPLLEKLDVVLPSARARGIKSIVAVSYDAASWPLVAQVSCHDGVFPAYGIHPWVAGSSESTVTREELYRVLDRPGVVAVGEIGLDYKVDNTDREGQRRALRLQLEVASERDLAVLLHCRGAFDDLLKIIDELRGRPLRGIVHAYSRSPELAHRLVAAGLSISFAGTITRPRARQARRSAVDVPLDKIVLETDAPSIGLEGIDAKKVEPCHVFDVARVLAELRSEPLETIARQTTENARQLLGM